ncbi:MAG: ssDNA-binding domain-containing protein [Prevotellaceae bacterium]|jgi:hypothetical protein|nr:ssDNA-binding domain-containing protein [Prevotellaceae bacterium]
MNTNKINEKRAELKELSKHLRNLVKEGAFYSINEGLKEAYKHRGHKNLNTLKQWNKLGKFVKKGEKALLLWGQPKQVKRVNEETTEVDEFDFWPICYVFSDLQVIDKEGK